MIGEKRVLAVIPARGGSKGLPGKNLADLGGKPLIAWSIEAARNSELIDRCVVSSEDDAILSAAKEWGGEAPFIRDPSLATDTARIEDVILDALARVDGDFGYLVLLQPTSPFRAAGDIDACIRRCAEQGAPACVTVTAPEKSPYWMFTLDERDCMRALIDAPAVGRRQDLPEVVALNGAVYVAETEFFEREKTFLTPETAGFIMPRERSVDIDSAFDLKLARALLMETA